jgi:sugar phosphate isomerase/epimerase
LPDRSLSDRTVSVSTAPYDGHPFEAALESLAACGARHVEPAYIVGYTEPFDESAFTAAETERHRRMIEASGLGCRAVSSHIDLGNADAVEVFSGRMRFARGIGADFILTNAAVVSNAAPFERHLEALLRLAEELGLVIALENPGDGRDNLMNTAAEGLALIARFDTPHLRLNYDAANTCSHRPGVDPAEDAVLSLPGCGHMHLKDVHRTDKGWFFTPIGDGDIDVARIFAGLRAHPDLPVSLELPLRLHRGPDAQPIRRSQPLPIKEIEAAITRSLQVIGAALG